MRALQESSSRIALHTHSFFQFVRVGNTNSRNTNSTRKLVSPAAKMELKKREEKHHDTSGKNLKILISHSTRARIVTARTRSLIIAKHKSLGTASCRALSRYCPTRYHNCGVAFNRAGPGNAARAQVHPQLPQNSMQLVCRPRACVINGDQILNVSPW